MRTFLTTLAIGLALGVPPAAAQDEAYSLESRAAIGAHHICSGLWVVGRVTRRTPVQIVAQDIRPFRDFSWDDRFTFHVSEVDKQVAVSGPGIATRIAKFNGDQGCAILPRGDTGIHFKPPGHVRKFLRQLSCDLRTFRARTNQTHVSNHDVD